MIIRYSVKEFEDLCGDTIECVQVLMDAKPIGVLLSDNDECPYAVVEYEGGRYSVCGVRSDGEVDYETAVLFLESK
jgi:hypothetical protein